MRTIKLTAETKKDILNNLLKRSPNNYGQYESTVAEIISNVREEGRSEERRVGKECRL